MSETPDSTPIPVAAYRALEQENRVLQERLAGTSPGGPDLRLLRLTETLRQENVRLSAESQDQGTKNIELVFHVEELEQGQKALQVALDEALLALQAARREAEEARSGREASERDLQAERERLQAEGAARLEEAARAGREERQALEAGLAELQTRFEEARDELEGARTRHEELEAELEGARALAERRAAEGAASSEELARVTERAASLETALAESGSLAEGLARELEQARPALAELEERRVRAAALEEELAGLRAGQQALTERVVSLEALLAEAREEVDQGARELVEARERLASVEGALVEARELAARELQEAREETASLEETLARAREEAASLEAALEEARERSSAVGAELAEAREQALAAREELQGELEAARSRAASLEATLRQVEEQFLARVEEHHLPPRREEEPAGPPSQALTRLMEALLGASGPVLVQRVYARCGVDPASRQPGELERVLRSLEETAARLVTSPEQRTRLAEGLARLRGLLGEGAPAEEAPPAPPEAPPTQPEEAPPTPAAEAPPAPEEPTRPRLHLPSEGGPRYRRTTDPALQERIREGMKLLALQKFDDSWDLFQEMARSHPDLLEVQEGLFYNYAESFCWTEACQVGQRILLDELDSPRPERFLKTMHGVLIEAVKAARDPGERKRLFLSLAEIHLDDPTQALAFLERARQIPGPEETEARVHYYLVRLQAGGPAEQLRNVLGALEGVADHVELFEDLERASGKPANRAVRPAAEVVLALVGRGREAGGEAERKAGGRVGPSEVDPSAVEEEHGDEANLVVEFLLAQLLPRAEVTLPFPSPALAALQAESDPVPPGWKPAEFLERLNWKLFRKRDLQTRLYRGREEFWLRATPEPAPLVLFHPEVEGLPVPEQQGLALRALFHLHHRHVHVWRAAEILDPPLRCRLLGLTRDLVQETGTDVSDSLEREIDSLDPARPDLVAAVDELLGRLYNHCLREEFLILRNFFQPGRPFAAQLEEAADRFVARVLGLTAASFETAREGLGRDPLFARLEQEGFRALYEPPFEKHRALRLRLQRLWRGRLEA